MYPMPKIQVVEKLEKNDLWGRLEKINGGIKYIIITSREDGQFDLHPRPNQPCYGGLIRKYASTHKNCTQPEDYKPHDLYYPFPDGEPVSLVYYFPVVDKRKELFDALWSDESPWISGFGGSGNVEFFETKDYDSYYGRKVYNGFWLKSGNFDPTVLVNLIHASCNLQLEMYKICIDKGMSIREALTFCSFFYLGNVYVYPSMNGYSFDPENSPKRMMEQHTVDLTGGTWGDKYDYNRKNMASIFRLSLGTEEDKKESYISIPKKFREIKTQKKLAKLNFDQCQEIFKEAIA